MAEVALADPYEFVAVDDPYADAQDEDDEALLLEEEVFEEAPPAKRSRTALGNPVNPEAGFEEVSLDAGDFAGDEVDLLLAEAEAEQAAQHEAGEVELQEFEAAETFGEEAPAGAAAFEDEAVEVESVSPCTPRDDPAAEEAPSFEPAPSPRVAFRAATSKAAAKPKARPATLRPAAWTSGRGGDVATPDLVLSWEDGMEGDGLEDGDQQDDLELISEDLVGERSGFTGDDDDWISDADDLGDEAPRWLVLDGEGDDLTVWAGAQTSASFLDDIDPDKVSDEEERSALESVCPTLAQYLIGHPQAWVTKKRRRPQAKGRFFSGEEKSTDVMADKVVTGCWACGRLDHESNECVFKRCFQCSEQGHEVSECPLVGSKHCNRCKRRGCTQPEDCPEKLKQEATQGLDEPAFCRCVKCGQEGHLNCGAVPSSASSRGGVQQGWGAQPARSDQALPSSWPSGKGNGWQQQGMMNNMQQWMAAGMAAMYGGGAGGGDGGGGPPAGDGNGWSARKVIPAWQGRNQQHQQRGGGRHQDADTSEGYRNHRDRARAAWADDAEEEEQQQEEEIRPRPSQRGGGSPGQSNWRDNAPWKQQSSQNNNGRWQNNNQQWSGQRNNGGQWRNGGGGGGGSGGGWNGYQGGHWKSNRR